MNHGLSMKPMIFLLTICPIIFLIKISLSYSSLYFGSSNGLILNLTFRGSRIIISFGKTDSKVS